jgi:predicted SAM-dependent methyltransferase
VRGTDTAIRLNIGGVKYHPGYRNVNIQQLPSVDHNWDCRKIDCDDDSVDEIYASHVLEHLSYQGDAMDALFEWYRVLKPGGMLRVSVPNLPTLCELYLRTLGKDRHHIMRIIYGGQVDAHDFHHAGYDFGTLSALLKGAGFSAVRQVQRFGIFDDCSGIKLADTYISLNIEAKK